MAARHEAASRKAVRRVPQAAASAVTSRLATAHLALPRARGASVPERPQDRRDSRQDRPGRPPRDAKRPTRSFAGGEGRGASRPDRPFRKPQGDPGPDRSPDRPTGGPRRFEGRPPAAAGRPPAAAAVQGTEQAVVQVRQGVQVVSAAPRAATVSHGRPSAVVNHALRETAPSSGRMLRQRAVRRKEAPVVPTLSPPAATAPSASSPLAPGPRLVQAKVASANHAPSALPVSVPAVPADSANLPVVLAASVSRALANRVAIASLLETGHQPVATAQQPAATAPDTASPTSPRIRFRRQANLGGLSGKPRL